MTNKEQIYDDQISPLMTDIPLIANFELADGEGEIKEIIHRT